MKYLPLLLGLIIANFVYDCVIYDNGWVKPMDTSFNQAWAFLVAWIWDRFAGGNHE